MQNFLLVVESNYKTSARSTNSTIFLIKPRLDISNLLSTKIKLVAKAPGLYYFQTEEQPEFAGEG